MNMVIRRKTDLAISMIGGEDGPTAVFLAGKFPDWRPLALIGISVLVLAGIGFGIFRRRKKRSKEHGAAR